MSRTNHLARQLGCRPSARAVVWRIRVRSTAAVHCALEGFPRSEMDSPRASDLEARRELLRNRLLQCFSRPQGNRRGRLAATSDRSAWDRLIQAALCSIDEGSITKVVLARSIAAESDRPFDPPRILAWLRRSVP